MSVITDGGGDSEISKAVGVWELMVVSFKVGLKSTPVLECYTFKTCTLINYYCSKSL